MSDKIQRLEEKIQSLEEKIQQIEKVKKIQQRSKTVIIDHLQETLGTQFFEDDFLVLSDENFIYSIGKGIIEAKIYQEQHEAEMQRQENEERQYREAMNDDLPF